MILHLTLIKKWYDMTESGGKLEEYREIKPYWAARLLNTKAEQQAKSIDSPSFYNPFTIARLRNGYGKKRPCFDREIESISVGFGRPEWGAEPDKNYFIIRYKPLK